MFATCTVAHCGTFWLLGIFCGTLKPSCPSMLLVHERLGKLAMGRGPSVGKCGVELMPSGSTCALCHVQQLPSVMGQLWGIFHIEPTMKGHVDGPVLYERWTREACVRNWPQDVAAIGGIALMVNKGACLRVVRPSMSFALAKLAKIRGFSEEFMYSEVDGLPLHTSSCVESSRLGLLHSLPCSLHPKSASHPGGKPVGRGELPLSWVSWGGNGTWARRSWRKVVFPRAGVSAQVQTGRDGSLARRGTLSLTIPSSRHRARSSGRRCAPKRALEVSSYIACSDSWQEN